MPEEIGKVTIHCSNCQYPREVNNTFLRVMPVPPPCSICGFSEWKTADDRVIQWGTNAS
jgi:ribosomal protein L37E